MYIKLYKYSIQSLVYLLLLYLNFKSYLLKYIQNLIDPSNSIISKYIDKSIENYNNVSDVNSLMFRNYKKNNESFEKNVSFEDKHEITNYDECNEGFELNYKSLSNKDNLNEQNINLLSLYIKILINQNKYLIEFNDKLNFMCNILSNPDIKYKKSDPFGNI